MAAIPSNRMNCGTALVYNNVAISNCTLQLFEQNVCMDASGSDLLKHDFNIGITGWIHSDDLPGFGPFVNEAGAVGGYATPATAQVMCQTLQAWLMHPRNSLYLYTEGVLLFSALGRDSLGTSEQQIGTDEDGQPILATKRNKVNTGRVDSNNVISEAPDYSQMSLHDVDNGPKPKSCRVTYVVGHKSFQIQFEISASVVRCNADLIATNPSGSSPTDTGTPDVPAGAGFNLAVLSNRWSITETRDANWLLSRTFSGKLAVRSYTDYAHAFRHLCLPPHLRGYQRIKMDFVQSPDGLSLAYSVVDQQRYAAPPRPAIDWRATHSENVEQFGHTGTATMSIWMRGSIGTPKAQLYTAAMAVIEHRIAKMNDATCAVIPKYLSLVDTLHEPEIQITASYTRTYQTPANTLANMYANMNFGMLGKLPAVNARVLPEGGDETDKNDAVRDDNIKSQWNRDKWPNPMPYDSNQPHGMFATYLQSPCVGWHGIPNEIIQVIPNKNPEYDKTAIVDPEIKVYEGETAGFPPPYDRYGQISPAHAQAIYTHYEIDSKYVIDHGIQALPLARNPEAGQATITAARVSQPICYRDVWIKAKRGGEMPDTPTAPATATDPNGITETLVYSNIAPAPPKLLTNGQQYEYEIEVFYRYVLNRMPLASEKLRAGSLPWDITTPTDNQLVIANSQTTNII